MPTLTTIRSLGNQLVAVFDDGSQAIAYPTQGGTYIVGILPGGTVGGGTSGGNTGGDIPEASDDYPWPNGDSNQTSPLGYAYVNCTDFVAWRMNRDVGTVSAPWTWTWGNMRLTDGDAIGWKADWQSHGWGVDITPRAGCIAWHGSEYGSYGHVEYVRAVNSDGSLDCEGYNLRQYGEGKYYHRTLAASDVASFLSPPGKAS